MRFTDVPMHDNDLKNIQMIELSDEELSEVTGTDGSAAVARSVYGLNTSIGMPSASACGATSSASAPMAGWSGPSIAALSTDNSFSVNYSTSLAVNGASKNSFLALG